MLLCPITKRLLKVTVGSEGLIFATDQIPGKPFPVYVKMVQILSLLSALGRLMTKGLGVERGEVQAPLPDFRSLAGSRRKRAVSGALFSAPRATRNMQGFG